MVKIIDKQAQQLLNRTLVTAETTYTGTTPKRNEIRKELSKALKAKEEQIIVRSIKAGFGSKTARISAVVYDKPETAHALEHKKLMEKHAAKKKPKEEKAEEATPTEEQKEEPKAEEAAPADKKKEEGV